jgi:hypothetical protein
MLVSSSESAGTLLGIGILYPIYQWSLHEDISFLAGGLPYYICAVSSRTLSFSGSHPPLLLFTGLARILTLLIRAEYLRGGGQSHLEPDTRCGLGSGASLAFSAGAGPVLSRWRSLGLQTERDSGQINDVLGTQLSVHYNYPAHIQLLILFWKQERYLESLVSRFKAEN